MVRRAIPILLLLFISFYFHSPVNAQEASGPTYIVQPNEYLSDIAARFNVSVAELMEVNGISDANQIFAGQTLIIPGLEGVSGLLQTEFINFGVSYKGLIRRTQVSESLFRRINRVVSPGEFYVGASMIVPTQDNGPTYDARVSPATGESLLELAVKQNTDTWILSSINSLDGSWDGLPGDTLYAPGGGGIQSSSGLPSALVSAEIRDLPLKQGGTGVIRVKTISGVTLSGILVDHPLHFFPMEDGTQVALQGVHALLEPGVYPLRLDATLADGTVQSFEQTILIVSGNYPTGENLIVDPASIGLDVTGPEDKQLVDLTFPSTPTKYWSGDFISPAIAYADSTYFTSRFGTRRVYIGQGTDLKLNWWHTGLDFGGGTGLPITAPAGGTVVFAGPLTVRGNATIIDHGWGVYSGFWHQSTIMVQVGQRVQQSEVIGLVGGTGLRLTGPHLHWELWVNGIQVDPLDWLERAYP